MNYVPSYKLLYENGKLRELAEIMREMLRCCKLCPRECKVNRLDGKTGFCRTKRFARVCSYNPHFGEEPPLVGKYGSGTIFFSYCNLGCLYCQNYEISNLGEGGEVNGRELAKIMLQLQRSGCHNINFVTPTHVVPQIIEALIIAVEEGLSVPLVYNTGGYDSVETLKLIEGVFDIYMPDAKYSNDDISRKYSGAPDYWEVNKSCMMTMQKAVGNLVTNEEEIAVKGLIVRHLVLPSNLSGSFEVLKFISDKISKDAYVNIMDQYRPCFEACNYAELSRSISRAEYKRAVEFARKLGLHRGF